MYFDYVFTAIFALEVIIKVREKIFFVRVGVVSINKLISLYVQVILFCQW